MKKLVLTLAYSLFFTYSLSLFPGLIDNSKLFLTDWNELDERLKQLKSDYTQLKESTQEELRILQEKLDHITQEVNQSKQELEIATGPEKEFVTKKISSENQIYQVIFNIQFTIREKLVLVEQHIKLLEDFKKDSVFKSLALEARSFYSYDAIQNALKRVFDEEEKIKLLVTQRTDSVTELENRKKKVSSAQKTYQDKKKELEDFAKSSTARTGTDITHKQKAQLLDLEEQLAKYELQLAEERVKMMERKVALINATIEIENEKLTIFTNNLSRIKLGLRIHDDEIEAAKKKFAQQQEQLLSAKSSQYEEIKQLTTQREQLKKEVDSLAARYKIVPTKKEELSSWLVEAPSLESYNALCEVGSKMVEWQILDRKIEYLEAKMHLDTLQLKSEEIKLLVLQSWYNLLQHPISETETIQQELKKFKDLEAELNRELHATLDRRTAVNNFINFQTKEAVNLRALVQEIKQEKEGMFKQYPIRFQNCISKLAEAEKILGEQTELANKLLEIYSSSASMLENTIKEINIIGSELTSKGFWKRSQYAISLKGIKKIIPDIGLFANNVRQLTISYFQNPFEEWQFTLQELVHNPQKIITALIVLLVLIIGYFLLYFQLPLVARYLRNTMPGQWTLNMVMHTIRCCLLFFHRYLLPLYVWLVLFIILFFYIVSVDLFIRVAFYILSIPFLMYYNRKFIQFLVAYNRQEKYPLFTDIFENRFVIAFAIFSNITIFIFFFREAFLFATLHKSELPNILLAFYSIVLRILIIFSIGKDEILILLQRPGAFWRSLSYIVDHYYYAIFINRYCVNDR